MCFLPRLARKRLLHTFRRGRVWMAFGWCRVIKGAKPREAAETNRNGNGLLRNAVHLMSRPSRSLSCPHGNHRNLRAFGIESRRWVQIQGREMRPTETTCKFLWVSGWDPNSGPACYILHVFIYVWLESRLACCEAVFEPPFFSKIMCWFETPFALASHRTIWEKFQVQFSFYVFTIFEDSCPCIRKNPYPRFYLLWKDYQSIYLSIYIYYIYILYIVLLIGSWSLRKVDSTMVGAI